MPRTAPAVRPHASMLLRIVKAWSALKVSLAASLATPAWQPVPVRIRDRPRDPGWPRR